MSSSWTWRYRPDCEQFESNPQYAQQAFLTQSEAENWLGAQWRELRAGGVTAAELLFEGEPHTEPVELIAG
ncbi:MAG: hypothetical protein ACRC0L_07605 [Angustibacter sp.]